MQKKSLLIAIEGIDGSGKSSLARNLHKSLKDKSIENILTKEPGDTKLGQQLRTILHEDKKLVGDKAEYLLFAADRAQHFEELIIPALKGEKYLDTTPSASLGTNGKMTDGKMTNGKIIISDRMGDSSVAYQGYGRGLDIEMIKKINKWAMKDIEPDIIFYLKIDFRIALPRVSKRGEKLTSFEIEEEQFWTRVSDGFEEIFAKKSTVITLNGEDSIENLTEQATEHVLKLLKND